MVSILFRVFFCLRLVHPMLTVSLDCPFANAPSVFSTVLWPLITPWVSSNWSYTFVVMGLNSQLGQLLINSITHECLLRNKLRHS